ncbi:hypothetical protein N0V93_010055 [Gnomoniopsis smithogilvyi]|uniref:PBP domain-containing protein n=1 Tax=Gnomoniopsis smithogilvyi TaxID=1191159 RepID=A0A9W8YJC0_9PEZI|nr:hypothetical protein N0V93_010055 [Gnomoniopsis smithogilvyi]
MSSLHTAIVSHGEVDREPAETYGAGPVLLRIGNGGAGATGLIKALAEDYLSTMPEKHSIQWICNHSRNTQLALLRGYIDVALTYERDQEELAAAEGWSHTAGCVMHDHFCVAGPLLDSARLGDATQLSQCLERIAEAKALFHSRADASATMWKERGLWKVVGKRPWEQLSDASVSSWYRTSVLTPAEALKKADKEGAYLLTDRSTLLRQVWLGNISNTTVFVEPDACDHVLMNSCYALCSPSASPETRAFVEYLLGDRAQCLIEAYGKDEAGLPLFAKAADGFARTRLTGGRVVYGKWVGV